MFKSNNTSELWIATKPQADELEKEYKQIKFITELKHNYNVKKEDRTYFHNKGKTTAITTGVSESLTVSIDYDDEQQAHKYLLKLLLGDIENLNNQFIKVKLKNFSTGTKTADIEITGKTTINFKNHIPSGNADEIVKLQIDFIPQDDAWKISEIEHQEDNREE